VIEKVVKMAISWQLEQCEDERAGAEFIDDKEKQIITIKLSMAPTAQVHHTKLRGL
jgi:hypothetical protein